MNRHCDTLVQRSRRLGLCGTTLCGAGIVLALIGAGPLEDRKVEPSASPPRPVEVQLLAVPSPRAAVQEATPAAAVAVQEATPAAAVAVPEVTPQPPAPAEIVPPEVTPQKKKAVAERKPHRQTPSRASRTTAAPVVAPVLPAVAGNESTRSLDEPSTTSTTMQAVKQAQASLLALLMAQFEQHKRYPPAARKLGLEGVVRMQVRVNAQGMITHIRLLDSNAHAMLCKSGMESLRKVQERWKNHPQPQDTVLEMAVRYTLSP